MQTHPDPMLVAQALLADDTMPEAPPADQVAVLRQLVAESERVYAIGRPQLRAALRARDPQAVGEIAHVMQAAQARRAACLAEIEAVLGAAAPDSGPKEHGPQADAQHGPQADAQDLLDARAAEVEAAAAE